MDNPEQRAPPASPWLFGLQGLGLLAIVTLVAAAASAVEVALLAGTLLVVGLLARVWAHFALVGLDYARSFSAARAFCGDTVALQTSVNNRKLLPLTWVEAWERVPLALGIGGETERSLDRPDTGWMNQGATLWPYQRARWRHEFTCRRRGVFLVGEARVRTGDPFSLFEREDIFPRRCELIVYPRVVRLRQLALPLQHPSLDAVGPRSLVTDPTRTAALREYQPGDPPRLIHWRSSAHRGELHVRVLEPAATLHVYLLLDVRGFQLSGAPVGDPSFELALSAIASVAMYLHESGRPVGLLVNTRPAVELAPSTSPARLEALLEALARLRAFPYQPLVPWCLPRLPRGSAVVLAASDAGLGLASDLERIREARHHVTAMVATARGAPSAGFPRGVLTLSQDRDLAATLEGRA